ncbi:MAG: hypothetical protein RLZZ602_168 [Pseudomonadota bacterium]
MNYIRFAAALVAFMLLGLASLIHAQTVIDFENATDETGELIRNHTGFSSSGFKLGDGSDGFTYEVNTGGSLKYVKTPGALYSGYNPQTQTSALVIKNTQTAFKPLGFVVTNPFYTEGGFAIRLLGYKEAAVIWSKSLTVGSSTEWQNQEVDLRPDNFAAVDQFVIQAQTPSELYLYLESWSYEVAGQAQTINFPAIFDKLATELPFTLSATSDSGLQVSFSSRTTNICSVIGNVVDLVAVGTCSVTASQPGDATYDAAEDVTQSFNISKAEQSITFTNPGNQIFENGSVVVTASASSSLPVTIASNSPAVCSYDGAAVSFVTGGSCSLTASQPGDANYLAATDVTITFVISAPDRDGDGIPDADDVFPDDPNEWLDSDGDGVGDNSDAFPNNPLETTDTDGDGVGDNADMFPNDPSETVDSDEDGIGNNADPDDDNDGFSDLAELEAGTNPLDPTSFPVDTTDTDGDGVIDANDGYPTVSLGGLTDSDGDGVPDDCGQIKGKDAPCKGGVMISDACPLEGAATFNGCPVLVDSDGDGVPDDDDLCPDTPPGDSVDANGCTIVPPADEDGDGVPNSDDLCPNTPPGATVDTSGCEITSTQDTDGDGVPDYLDGYPNVSLGGLTDSDGDGVPDNCNEIKGKNSPCKGGAMISDACPSVPAATLDGCPSLPDSDGDGVTDDNDACPNTPAGDTVDATGCTVEPPADDDGDGVSNGDDLCPNTPPGATVDASGCEITAPVDADGDGFSPPEDCDDNNAQVYPGANDTKGKAGRDDIDNDCNGTVNG